MIKRCCLDWQAFWFLIAGIVVQITWIIEKPYEWGLWCQLLLGVGYACTIARILRAKHLGKWPFE